MNSNPPLLSIVVLLEKPLSSLLPECINSILDQKELAFEIIIVNSGLANTLLNTFPFVDDPRIQWIHHARTTNIPSCYNTIVKKGMSSFLTFINPRYTFQSLAFAKLTAQLIEQPQLGKIGSYYYQVGEEGKTSRASFYLQKAYQTKNLGPEADLKMELLKYGHARLQEFGVYRRSVLKAVGLFDENLSKDWLLEVDFRIIDRFRYSIFPEFLYYRKEKPEILSPAALWRKKKDQYFLIRQLAKRDKNYYFQREGFPTRQILIGRNSNGLKSSKLNYRLQPLKQKYYIARRFLKKGLPALLIAQVYRFVWNYCSWWPFRWTKLHLRTKKPVGDHLGYFTWKYPSLSQTFIQRELKALKSSGLKLTVFAEKSDQVDLLERQARRLIPSTHYLLPIDQKRLADYRRFFLKKNPIRFIQLLLYVITHRYHAVKNWHQDRMVFSKALYLAGHLSAHNVTHIHSPWASIDAFIVMLAARLLGISYSLQGRAHDLHRRSELYSLVPKLQNARFVITNTQYNVKRIENLSKLKLDQGLFQIYNGLDLDRFDPSSRIPGPERLFRILSVGRLIEQKGHIYLLKALKLLKNKKLDFSCEIVGGPEEPLYLNYHLELKKLHRSLGLEEHVVFAGSLPFDRVLEKYREADLFVLPCVIAEDGSRDIIPNAVLEAMAMQLPVIATDIVGLPEMIEHGVSGILIPPEDECVLAETIEDLMHRKAFRQQLGKNARLRVEEKFDIEKNIKAFESLFNIHGAMKS